jgi:hypothetical protein
MYWWLSRADKDIKLCNLANTSANCCRTTGLLIQPHLQICEFAVLIKLSLCGMKKFPALFYWRPVCSLWGSNLSTLRRKPPSAHASLLYRRKFRGLAQVFVLYTAEPPKKKDKKTLNGLSHISQLVILLDGDPWYLALAITKPWRIINLILFASNRPYNLNNKI